MPLSEIHQQISDVTRRFATEVIRPAAEELDREERFPEEIYRQMGELGLFGITVPGDLGGAGMDALAYSIVMEELSRGYAYRRPVWPGGTGRHFAHPTRQ
jgi:alkylation response protein AidB-like acyl-CoA dehydrogenase